VLLVSLRARLILSYVLIVVLCLGVAAVAVSLLLQNYRDRFTQARLDDMTIPIYLQIVSLVQGRSSWDEAWDNLEEMADKTGVYIILVDDDTMVLRQAAPQPNLLRNTTQLPINMSGTETAAPYHGTYSLNRRQIFAYVAYPLSDLPAAGRLGASTLLLVLPQSGALLLWAGVIRPFIWAGLIGLGTSLGIAIFLARSVYRPLKRVTQAANEIAQGKYDHEIELGGPSEVVRLANAFNKMAQQVKLSNQQLRDFVADVSHQLRTPLTSIRGFAQAILDNTAHSREAKLRAAQVIEEESQRMMLQVNGLLELSRMQAGQIEIVRNPVDINELVEHCREIFVKRSKEQRVTLTVAGGTVDRVIGDIDRLEQVFTNLLDNALKHTPPGGEITITTSQSDAYRLEVVVTDTGHGIPPEQLSHIFERFYQADTPQSGIGLGLAIAREIVMAHGGEITVSSTVGQGTSFRITLPTE
jgi:signal transduction histidine kinase